jgi:glycosyltransferase domain-containing protein
MLNDIDKNLTIILVLKDRVNFTYRWMEYANLIKLPFKVVILDGGSDPAVERELLSGEKYNNVNYQYCRYPYDETYQDFYSKLASAFKHVTTDYVALADNDDFFITKGLRESVDFLMKNPDYASCGGQTGGIFFKNKRNFEFGISSSAPKDINDKSAIERVKKNFASYDVTYYDVHRSEQLKESFNKLKNLNPSDLFIHEIIVSSLAVASGKTKKNNYLYLVRQNNSPGSVATSTQSNNNYFGRMFIDSWLKDFNNLSYAIVSALTKNNDNNENEAITLSINEFYKEFLLKNIHTDILKKIPFIKRNLIKYLMRDKISVEFTFRKIYSIFCRVRYKNGKVNMLGRLLWFYNDVTAIAKVLRKP